MIIDVHRAIDFLAQGEVVAIPTETVYGLAANAINNLAVAKIYQLKKRPKFNPLILHVYSLEQAQEFAHMNSLAIDLARDFWVQKDHQQGNRPLTFVMRLKENTGISPLCTAGLDTIAIRKPLHPLALKILRGLDHPLVIPSANLSSSLSPTTREQVQRGLGEHVPIVDGGPCRIGIESTIIDLSSSKATILRHGAVTKEMIENIAGHPVFFDCGAQGIRAPGMMQRHYAPDMPMRINVLKPRIDEVLIGFGPTTQPVLFNLSLTGDLVEAAANLYKALDLANQSGAHAIAVMPIPAHGLGLAINDRLCRGAIIEEE